MYSKKGLCLNVDNTVILLVGRGSLARKQFALCITPKVVVIGSGRQTLPLQLMI